MKKRSGIVAAFLRGFLRPVDEPPPPTIDGDPLDTPPTPAPTPIARALGSVPPTSTIIIRVEAGPITSAYARMEATSRDIELRWSRGIGIRMWGENGCAPVSITCATGEEGQLDYAFGEDAERLGLS